MNNKLLPLENSATKIIRAKNQKTASLDFGGLIKHQVLDAEIKARSILKKAKENAKNLIANANAEAEEIRLEAYKQGRAEAENEFLENLLEIKELRSQAFLTVEQDVLRLAVKLAEKIIGKEIKDDEKAHAEIVLNALRQTRRQEMLTVRVNAADLHILEEMREKINVFGREQFIDFVADKSVVKGGCIIESASGTIDARLETQLRILENALLTKSENEAR